MKVTRPQNKRMTVKDTNVMAIVHTTSEDATSSLGAIYVMY